MNLELDLCARGPVLLHINQSAAIFFFDKYILALFVEFSPRLFLFFIVFIFIHTFLFVKKN